MKRTAHLITVAFAVTLVTAACSSGDETVDVGVENNYPPFNFIAADGEGVGFDYDIWAELCDRIGCTPEFVEATWPAVIEDTGQGIYDTAADGIRITDEHKAVVDFSDPYMTIIQKLMVRMDDIRFNSAAEFEAGEYLLGTLAGSTNELLGSEMVGDARIDAYPDFSLAVQALIAGAVDAVIIDDIAGQGYVGTSRDQTRLLSDELRSVQLGFIFPIGSELATEVNTALEEMAADGSLEAVIRKWFIDFVPPTE